VDKGKERFLSSTPREQPENYWTRLQGAAAGRRGFRAGCGTLSRARQVMPAVLLSPDCGSQRAAVQQGTEPSGFGISMAWNIGFNVVKEFLPDIMAPFTKKH